MVFLGHNLPNTSAFQLMPGLYALQIPTQEYVASERKQYAKLERIQQEINTERLKRRNVTEATFEVSDGFCKLPLPY